ncbi:urea carboxylase [Bacterioplanes sanyensis]|uniref:urea carboxylase n=1 Tax=Bacterioplanes sanyensis TaxID=1249553 RepID=UPI0016723694|nr:urea carboxylase [Bacterioplanes sanyensis]GGY49056.1 urea carboxylase [Bacterioplanes sanyensis]
MFNKVLIANRGEIAVRIARTLKRMGIASVAIYAEADRNSAHVSCADESYSLGEGSVADTYLQGERILQLALDCGAQAIIPGYGFLSENADFAEQCEAQGLVFVGPTPQQMRDFGLKHTSRELCQQAGVPLTPGTGLLDNLEQALAAAQQIGYPIMLKSTAGGGGIGLTRCDDEQALRDAFDTTRRLGENYFRDGGVFIERFVARARHIEVQIFGDGQGQVVALGERDCSLQRRNQKVVEETPAPNLPEATRQALHQAAIDLGRSVNYRNAGTVEFIYDQQRDEFYFLEVNSRLQVEHPVTEMVTGIDLVQWMIELASGTTPEQMAGFSSATASAPRIQGAAIEVRIYAEDPLKNFQPAPGVLTHVQFPQDTHVRVDTWVSSGTEVSALYDPMLAKLIVHGEDRIDAMAKLQTALDHTSLAGIATNLDYLRQIIAWPQFQAAEVSTRALESFGYQPRHIEVLKPGTYTSVQDYPGRKGYWDIGVPPSGPMDDYAFRLANRMVGNHASAAALETTLIGPELMFHSDAVIALTGASSQALLDGSPVPLWQPIAVTAGQTLQLGKVEKGCRQYLAVRGGLDVPQYLGSRSTFALGQFGGHGGRTLRASDMLAISDASIAACTTPAPRYPAQAAPAELIPSYPHSEEGGAVWEIGVMYGPHGAPDFFTSDSIQQFLTTDWEVHYNSNRLGIRLNGPKPEFARQDGGEAGLHPSNIHDCEYAIGSINFTGDMPVILTHDGPSLGGFVCPVTIVQSELWKVGQVKPGDRIRFVPMTFEQALAQEQSIDQAIETLRPFSELANEQAKFGQPQSRFGQPSLEPGDTASATILAQLPASEGRPEAVYRQAGDKYILIEYGPVALDLSFRFRIHALMQALKQRGIAGLEEMAPGVRSLQIRYDSRVIHQQDLMQALLDTEASLPDSRNMSLKTRVVHLPMAFEDSATLDAVAKYQQSVQEKAPWLPNNVDFIQRINGLDSRDDVKRIIYDASYMVLGLGDVYLGAPCAVPVDPRHRLLTSKYNPARTFTAEGTVGIGGVYMCIYGMDSPGGYQLVGRTLPIWNKYLKNSQFAAGEPWLLKFFDQVRYYEVSEEELTQQREAFREGRLNVRITEEDFSLAEYQKFLENNDDSIRAFKQQQQAAFAKEVEHWNSGDAFSAVKEQAQGIASVELDGEAVHSDIAGNIWKLEVQPGQRVKAGDVLLIVEAMKMEFPILAPMDGTIATLCCEEGMAVQPGDAVLSIEPAEQEVLV